ncbi:MAG: type II toxin-antitoxin system VapB family antitoxin [Terriglobales bacterium]
MDCGRIAGARRRAGRRTRGKIAARTSRAFPLTRPCRSRSRLIEAARRAGRHRTKKEAVTAALREYVLRRKRLRLLELFAEALLHLFYHAAEPGAN